MKSSPTEHLLKFKKPLKAFGTNNSLSLVGLLYPLFRVNASLALGPTDGSFLINGKTVRDCDVLELITKRSRSNIKVVLCPVHFYRILIFLGTKQRRKKFLTECVENLVKMRN